MCVLLLCTIRTRKPTFKNCDRTAQSLAQTTPHAPSKIPKQKQQKRQKDPEQEPGKPIEADPPKPSLLPKPKVKVVIPPALQQRLKQHQQKEQQPLSPPEEPAIPEEEVPLRTLPEPEDSQSAPGGSRIPVRTLKAERRALAAAARQSGLRVEEYLRQLEMEMEESTSQPTTPTTPTTPTSGKSRAMIK